MSNPTWPTTLPASPNDQGMGYSPLVDPILTTQMETGAPKRRRRFTSVPDMFTCTMTLTKTQVPLLQAFVITTLADVGPFDWKDFRDDSAATYVFNKRPVYSLAAPGVWIATLDLQKVP
jgi:hypothetical protein